MTRAGNGNEPILCNEHHVKEHGGAHKVACTRVWQLFDKVMSARGSERREGVDGKQLGRLRTTTYGIQESDAAKASKAAAKATSFAKSPLAQHTRSYTHVHNAKSKQLLQLDSH